MRIKTENEVNSKFKFEFKPFLNYFFSTTNPELVFNLLFNCLQAKQRAEFEREQHAAEERARVERGDPEDEESMVQRLNEELFGASAGGGGGGGSSGTGSGTGSGGDSSGGSDSASSYRLERDLAVVGMRPSSNSTLRPTKKFVPQKVIESPHWHADVLELCSPKVNPSLLSRQVFGKIVVDANTGMATMRTTSAEPWRISDVSSQTAIKRLQSPIEYKMSAAFANLETMDGKKGAVESVMYLSAPPGGLWHLVECSVYSFDSATVGK